MPDSTYLPFIASGSDPKPELPGVRWDPRLTQRGTVLNTYTPAPGESYWKLVSAQWLDKDESQGRHHIYVDALDRWGQRLPNVPVRFFWATGDAISDTELKPGEPSATNFPMNAVGGYSCQMANAHSDTVASMGMGSIEAPDMGIHTSYMLTFQWVTAPTQQPVTPTMPQTQPVSDGNFDRCLRFTLRWEGGYANNPNDPGGETNFGISKTAHPDLDIKNLLLEQAIEIYRENYWKPSGAANLAWPLCLAMFDAYVQNETAAMRFLAECNNNFDTFMGLRITWYTKLTQFNMFGVAWMRRLGDLLMEANK